MNEQDVANAWQELCEKQEAAKERFISAFSPVNQKLTSIAKGSGATNPSPEESQNYHEAWEAWQDVLKRMDEFVKKHA